ncbi:uncharacterized protein I303_101421 [Kwoniella dejecticola CBS 10117]|uniref:Major facilitator superfamily (MFS) profile domain-containing protein n=1 Tax=Kwoniella dejecticola CBS 10117 TaxID=1296121 RepID=A0A1A6AHT0_9TREE|nr:uncharacterized protein I303_01430 [Kwoniella dejecticola CBS 10117]OBR89601.1 hypothetical protein I303_01430 [Kwoniella dejecticola CBS 10117]
MSQSATDKPPATQAQPAMTPPPNGGFAAWSTVAGCWVALFVQFGLCNSFGVFQAYYETHLIQDKTPSDIAWIGTIQVFILFFGGLFVGRFLDSHGAHVLTVPGSILLVLGLMFTSLCKEYWQLILAQGVLFGIGCSLTFHPCVALPSQWFSTKRALATSIAIAGSGIGGVVWPIVIRVLFDRVGFPWGTRAVGFISLGLLALSNALIKKRAPKRSPLPWTQVARLGMDLRFALTVSSVALSILGFFVPFYYISTNAIESGASPSLAFYCIAFVNAGSSVGRLLAGFITFISPFMLIALSSMMCGIFILAMWVSLKTTAALIAFGIIYGFFSGIWISAIPPSIASISKIPEIGTRIGLLWGLCSIFALVGPPIAGAIVNGHDGLTGFRLAAVFSGVTMLAGGALSLIVWMLNKRNQSVG